VGYIQTVEEMWETVEGKDIDGTLREALDETMQTTFPDEFEEIYKGKFEVGDVVMWNTSEKHRRLQRYQNRPGIVVRKWLMPSEAAHYEVLWGTEKIRVGEARLVLA
jgi:hypothetical protein